MAGGGPARRTGLGRGLQALLPEAGEQAPPPDPAGWFAAGDVRIPGRLAEVAETGLALLEQSLSLDLCAYVHAPGRSRPQLWLRSRPTRPIAPRDSSELGLAAAGLILAGVRAPRSIELAGRELLAVPTRGAASEGIHLLGRDHPPLSDPERTVAIHLVQALGEALHGLAAGDPAPAAVGSPSRVEPASPVEPAARAQPAAPMEAPARVEHHAPTEPPVPVASPAAVLPPGPAPAVRRSSRPLRQAVTARWPAVDLERIVEEAVRASGVRHLEVAVREVVDAGVAVIDVSAAHRGDRVHVVLPADPDDPARAATTAGRQAARMLHLIGADPDRSGHGDRAAASA